MPKRTPNKQQALTTIEPIEPVIRFMRGQRVILDSDLARIYGVTTKVLNQAIKRNSERFPQDFVFQLNLEESREVTRLRSQTVTSKKGRGGRRYLPYAFTEHGAVMAANVLLFSQIRRLLKPPPPQPEPKRQRIGF